MFIHSNHLEATVNRKPTDSHLYLEASSCHKKSSETDIIKVVAFPLRRTCSTMYDFKIKSLEYMAYLVARENSAK